MKEKDITFCPTMQFFYEWYSEYEPPYRPVLDSYPGETTAEKELNRTIANFQAAVEKGIRIVVGSDSFCSTLTPYGKYAITEAKTLVTSGLTPMQMIAAALKTFEKHFVPNAWMK
jgi:imidazolonepropionase-like amidohydrolase